MILLFEKQLSDHLTALSGLHRLSATIFTAGEAMIEAIRAGRKILVCGNGGSAADAQHFAAELVARFELERRAWPAIALTTDTSILTAISNDYGFEAVSSRQVEALGGSGDILLCISTSGNSLNILRAAEAARFHYLKLTGIKTGLLINFNVPILKRGIKRLSLTRATKAATVSGRLPAANQKALPSVSSVPLWFDQRKPTPRRQSP